MLQAEVAAPVMTIRQEQDLWSAMMHPTTQQSDPTDWQALSAIQLITKPWHRMVLVQRAMVVPVRTVM